MQVTPLNPKVTNKSLLLTVDECGLWEVDQHFYVDVPYSGKFLHGANFAFFADGPTTAKIKTVNV